MSKQQFLQPMQEHSSSRDCVKNGTKRPTPGISWIRLMGSSTPLPQNSFYIMICHMKLLMICFNCYTEFHPKFSKPLCPNCSFCYWCRDFTCFHHDANNGLQKKQ